MPDTERTLRPRRGLLRLGVTCLALFVGMFVVSTGVFLCDPSVPPTRRVLLAVLCGSIWLFMATLSGLMIVSCCRESWHVNKLLVRHVGLFRTREIVFAHVSKLRWICSAAGTISLKTPRQSLRISLENFTKEERLWLIHMLRGIVPDSPQVNWDQFCGGIAVPLSRPVENPDRRLKPDEGRFTRGRCDLYFGVLFAATMGTVLFLEHVPDRLPQRIVAPIVVIAFWLLLRFQIPRSGLIATRLRSGPKISRWIWGMLAWSLLPLIWIFSAGQRKHEPLEFSWPLIIEVICYLAVFGWMICQVDRQTARVVQERRRLAAREWKSSESPR